MRFDIDTVNKIVSPDYFQPRQFDVLKLKLRGYSDKEIAEELGLKASSIKNRVYEIKWIIGLAFHGERIGNRGLFDWAIEHGLIEVKV